MPSGAGPTSSRESANSSRAAPTDASQRAAEGADRGTDGDELADPPRDELAAEVAEQRARAMKLPDSLGVGAEAHHLYCGDEDEVQAAEDSDAEDRARYVAAGLPRLLAQRRGRLEAREGEEPEHHAEEHGRGARAGRHREHREVQGVAVRGRAGGEPDQDDDADYEDERRPSFPR